MSFLKSPFVGHAFLRFDVTGRPQPGGSKRAFIHKATGRAVITDDNPKAKRWMADVAEAALATGCELYEGPMEVEAIFRQERPLGHYGTGKNAGVLKDKAPFYKTNKPDATKLWRSTEDALTGIVWKDDAQIVKQTITKRYVGHGEKTGVQITARRLD